MQDTLRESDQFQMVLALYDLDILQKDMRATRDFKSIVEKRLGQKVRARYHEARNKRTATGTPAKSKNKGKSVSVE